MKVYISLSLKSNESGLLIKLTATGQNACVDNLVQGGQWRESNPTKFHPFVLLLQLLLQLLFLIRFWS